MTNDEFERAQDKRLVQWEPFHFVINPYYTHPPVTEYAREIVRLTFNALNRAHIESRATYNRRNIR